MNSGRAISRLALITAVTLVCGSLFLIIVLRDGRRLALGLDTTSRGGIAEGESGEAKKPLETSNLEASKKR